MMKTLSSPIRVLLVDDHELFRNGVANLLNQQQDIEVVGEAGDGLEGYYRAVAQKPDLILMDINMPGVDGLEALSMIRSDLPEATIVILTVHDEDEKVFQALGLGAHGYMLKNASSDDFLRMLRGAMRDEAALSPKLAGKILAEFTRISREETLPPAKEKVDAQLTLREKQVLKCVREGLSDKEIAVRLSLSIHTVKSHMRNILAKLQVENRHAAAALTGGQTG